MNGQRTSDSATGTAANASTCRERRYDPVRAERPHDAVEEPADDEVRERAGDAAGGEHPDREVDAVARRVVEIGASRPARIAAIPASQTIRRTGSARSATASGSSSRSATNTGRGRWSTSSVRSHQSRTSETLACRGDDAAVVAAVLGLAEQAAALRRPAPCRRGRSCGGGCSTPRPSRRRRRREHTRAEHDQHRALALPVHAGDAQRARSSSGRRNCPVYDSSTAATSSGVPDAMISPPASPPSGPRSTR